MRVESILVAVALGVLFSTGATAAEPKRLTTDGLVKRDPIFWPGKNELIYVVEQPTGRMKLTKLPLAGGKSELLHPDESLSDREITFSADGQVYAYNSITGAKGINSEVVVVDLPNKRTISTSSRGFSHWPGLSPDGKKLFYSRQANDLVLWEINYEKPAPPPMETKEQAMERRRRNELPTGTTRIVSDGFWPRFSPDGSKVVFATPRDGNYEIYAVDPDGKNPQRLTDSPGMDARPVYSPDGQQIAFISNRDGNYEVYVMQSDGKNVCRVTNHPERDEDPAWHPDGKQLVVLSERDGEFDLYLVEVPQ